MECFYFNISSVVFDNTKFFEKPEFSTAVYLHDIKKKKNILKDQRLKMSATHTYMHVPLLLTTQYTDFALFSVALSSNPGFFNHKTRSLNQKENMKYFNDYSYENPSSFKTFYN